MENKLEMKCNDVYYKAMFEKRPEILFVGRDPYPTGATNIPFCKKELKILKHKNKSGYFVLKGFGIDLDELSEIDKVRYEENTEEIFYKLLSQGIGFINASLYFLKGLNVEDKAKAIVESKARNLPIIEASAKILCTRSSIELLRDYNFNFEAKIVPHPAPMGRNIHNENHIKYYQSNNGIMNNIDKMEIIEIGQNK